MADAMDNVGVAGAQFQLDGTPFGPEMTSAPYSIPWDTHAAFNGAHVLSAIAWDATGAIGEATSITVTVSNPPPAATVSWWKTY